MARLANCFNNEGKYGWFKMVMSHAARKCTEKDCGDGEECKCDDFVGSFFCVVRDDHQV